MFGYVRPAADRLTQEQTDLFRSAYCGLCRTLGRRYGLPARMILNYDLAFLAILLAGGSGFSCACHRCPVHPVRGCPCGEENPALDAAADLPLELCTRPRLNALLRAAEVLSGRESLTVQAAAMLLLEVPYLRSRRVRGVG